MIVYYSKTNNTERFINKLQSTSVSISDYNGKDKYILLTPTYFFGEIPKKVTDFLETHSKNMVGVISTGNKNWGENFAKAGDKISDIYNVPLLHKMELSGNKKDIEIVDKIVNDML